MIDESPNIIKLKSRNIFNEIREKVKPITATEEKQDKRVEGQESIEEILSDIDNVIIKIKEIIWKLKNK